jgi:hypothetical protein
LRVGKHENIISMTGNFSRQILDGLRGVSIGK